MPLLGLAQQRHGKSKVSVLYVSARARARVHRRCRAKIPPAHGYTKIAGNGSDVHQT